MTIENFLVWLYVGSHFINYSRIDNRIFKKSTYAHLQFHVSCGKEVDLANALLKFSQTAQKQEEAVPFLERLQEEVQSKLDEENARES